MHTQDTYIKSIVHTCNKNVIIDISKEFITILNEN